MQYQTLKDYVRIVGGPRVFAAGGLRDQIVDWCVADWPEGVAPERRREVLRARISQRVRQRYSGVLATMIIWCIVERVIGLVIEWFLHHRDHRRQMVIWCRDAAAS